MAGVKPYRRFITYLGRYRGLIAVAFGLSLVFVMLNSLSLWMVASLINTVLVSPESIPVSSSTIPAADTLYGQLRAFTASLIQQSTPLKTLARLVWLLLSIFLLKNIVLYAKNMTAGIMENRLIRDLRNDLFAHIQTLSLAYFAQQKSAEIASIVLNDVAAVRRAFTVSLQKLVVEPINLIVMMTILFIISWELSLLAIPLIPLAALFTTRLGRSLRRRARRTSRQIAGAMEVLQSNIRGMRIVKAFSMEGHENNRFREVNQSYYRLVFKRFSLRNLSTPINEMIGVFIGVIILWVGGQQVLLGHGVGAEEFMSYLIFMFAMLQPLRSLSAIAASIQVGLASAERIFSILDVPASIVDQPGAREISDLTDAIRFQDVTFKYEDGAENVVHGINFEINKGDVVALVGTSGSGKSTIVDLIPRFHDVTGGSITFDGTDIRDLKIGALRALIGIVTQETLLFNATARENILYGKPDASDEQIMAAARAAHAWEFIQELPDGFETVIGEDGALLSGGQKQRLTIARALLKNPPILILDEATSALDTESERLVQAAIAELIHDRTVIVIAHRLSTIQNANVILVLENGRIVESGSHENLMASQGKYYQLYDQQIVSSPKVERTSI